MVAPSDNTGIVPFLPVAFQRKPKETQPLPFGPRPDDRAVDTGPDRSRY